MAHSEITARRFAYLTGFAGLIIGLFWTSRYNYLLFHTLIELFSVVVACGIFMFAWNTRRLIDNAYFLCIGIGYLFVAWLDTAHLLAYRGMPIFTGADTNLPTQLWIAARYLESLSLLVACFFIRRAVNSYTLLLVYFLTSVFLFLSIFYWKVFPACFVEGDGLTNFKIVSEYIIAFIMLGTLVILMRQKEEFEPIVFRLIIASVAATILTELTFTLYISVFGLSNLVGHILKLFSFLLVYKAIIEKGMSQPYTLLFRNLNHSKMALQQARDELQERVKARTADLAHTNTMLRAEIEERKQAEKRLLKSKHRLQSVFEGIQDPLILLSKDLRIKMMNMAAMNHFGLKNIIKAIGSSCYEAFLQKSEPCPNCKIQSALASGYNETFERTGLMMADRIENVSVFICKDTDGRIQDGIVQIRDVTERRLFERQLIQSEKMASMSLLVSGVVHEIKNLNNFTSFNLPMLKEYLDEILPFADTHACEHQDFEVLNMPYCDFREDIFKLIGNMDRGAERIGKFVNNLTNFTRQAMLGDTQWVDPKVLINRTIEICRPKLIRMVKSVQVEFAPDLSSIYTDISAIEHILVNLMINAAQAADKKDSWINVRISCGYTWLDNFIIEVTDNGHGIPTDRLDQIFDPFYTTKAPEQGTGLGLYTCRNLVESIGGRLEVHSTPCEGSTFKVILHGAERRMKDRSRQ